MMWGRLLALAAGGAGLGWIVASVGAATIVRDVALAGWALPAAVAIHGVQLWFSGLAWRAALGSGGIGSGIFARFRWIREGVNTLVPAAQIGGQVVSVRLLVRVGVSPPLAVAGTILDLALEAVSELIVLLAAVGVLAAIRDGDRGWLVWVASGAGGTALGVAGLVVALRLGVLRLVEAGLERAAARWPGTWGPGTGSARWSLAGLHGRLMERLSDWKAIGRALLLHSISWSLGAFEVSVLLAALGAPVGLGAAFVIESLAMAARSAGFAVPGAVGIQEGGFVLVCGLFGIGADVAVALSVLKRLRELVVGAGALLVWQLAGGAGSVRALCDQTESSGRK